MHLVHLREMHHQDEQRREPDLGLALRAVLFEPKYILMRIMEIYLKLTCNCAAICKRKILDASGSDWFRFWFCPPKMI